MNIKTEEDPCIGCLGMANNDCRYCKKMNQIGKRPLQSDADSMRECNDQAESIEKAENAI